MAAVFPLHGASAKDARIQHIQQQSPTVRLRYMGRLRNRLWVQPQILNAQVQHIPGQAV